MRNLFLCVIALMLSGCLTMQPAAAPKSEFEKNELQITSAGFIGCEPKAIRISEIVTISGVISNQAFPMSWKAQCKNTTFICSEVTSETSHQVSCRAELE